MKYEYKIVFRNGHKFKFKADSFECTTGVTEQGHTTMKDAKFYGSVSGEHPVFFSLDDIVLITANELTQPNGAVSQD